MFARARKDRPMAYICSSYSKNGRSACTSHHIREEVLVDIVVEDILNLIEKAAIDSEFTKRCEELFSKDDSKIESEKLDKQLGLKLKQQEMLYLDRLEGKISEDLFMRMNKQLEDKVELIRAEIEGIKKRSTVLMGGTEIIGMLRNQLRACKITNEMIKAVVGKVVVFDIGDKYPAEIWGDLMTIEDRERLSEFGGVVVEYNY
jgi:hypothetical protein